MYIIFLLYLKSVIKTSLIRFNETIEFIQKYMYTYALLNVAATRYKVL